MSIENELIKRVIKKIHQEDSIEIENYFKFLQLLNDDFNGFKKEVVVLEDLESIDVMGLFRLIREKSILIQGFDENRLIDAISNLQNIEIINTDYV